VVCNCAVLTEGWDAPEVSCLVLARPTKSLGLYRQMVGRVLRPAADKSDALILDHSGAVFQHGFPEDPIEWTLSDDRRAENKTHSARMQYGAPTLTTCPECQAVRFSGKPCVVCGWRPQPKATVVDVVDGDLGRVNRQRGVSLDTIGPEGRALWHRQLVWIARDRGYNVGWAAHKYRERFGTWPAGGHVEPLAPDAVVSAWVRSRQIAYAKAMAKQRGAA
jgi:DNA repair protein RadD